MVTMMAAPTVPSTMHGNVSRIYNSRNNLSKMAGVSPFLSLSASHSAQHMQECSSRKPLILRRVSCSAVPLNHINLEKLAQTSANSIPHSNLILLYRFIPVSISPHFTSPTLTIAITMHHLGSHCQSDIQSNAGTCIT